MALLTLKDGSKLSYQEFGSGDKVLLCMQNFFLSGSHMELMAGERFGYHTYLIRMRGFGTSERNLDNRPTDWVKTWGEDLIAFADALGVDRFYYTGISHGSLPGWYAAMHYPQRLRGFAAVSGLPLFTPPGGPLPIQVPQWYEDGIIGNPEKLKKMAWDAFLPTNDPKRLAKREANRKEHLELLMSRTRDEFEVAPTTMSCCEARTEEEFYRKISEINVPVLVLYGLRDVSSTISEAIHIFSLIRGAKFVSYENYEHGTPDECPEPVAYECARFFQETEGRIF